uniref:Ig-like domain-containing protein n=1 Tax=Neovison vison TaxID=452646 RepID=A0A8C7EVD0_NEOVI
MGCGLLCCVDLCLLGASPMEAEITQTPRYSIIQTGTKKTLECSQDMNHFSMFWYRQDPGQGLRLIYYSSGSPSTTKGDVAEGYSVSRKEQKFFPLTLESASTNQTSVYLCASSESTT